MEINDIREKIDEIDDNMLELFLQRLELSEAAAQYKIENSLPISDDKRENEILTRISQKAQEKGLYALRLFRTVFDISKQRQKELILKNTELKGGVAAGFGRRNGYRFMDEKIYGLLGRRLSHSYSVSIHQRLGCPGYRLFELEPQELADFLHRSDIGGLNITIPYKSDAMALCDTLSPEAHDIGSVNTVVRKKGVLVGYNTDAYGFMYMVKRADISFANRKALILGTGGAGLAAKYSAEALGAREIITVSRTGENNYDNLDRHKDAEIIINATPVGMYPNNGSSPVSLERFDNCTGVIDMIYNPLRTVLLIEARERGIPCCNGLMMLVAQAKAAEEVFFNKSIDEREIIKIAAGLCRRTENIILIGMPGSGKTTVGRYLSVLCGRNCVDIDSEIEKEAGCTVPEIFERCGEKEFRRLETEVTARVSSEHGIVITTGGGVVTEKRNYPLLHQNGRIYFLERDLDRLSQRGRPLSLGSDLNQMYRERLPLYKSFCDAAIMNSTAPDRTAKEIWRDFCENTRN